MEKMISPLPLLIFGLFALSLSSSVCHADIYAYVDKNGVRHISNSPDDPRYKLVMRTPKYKTPPKPQSSAKNSAKGEQGNLAKLHLEQNGTGWRLITPNGKTAVLGNYSIKRGKVGKPFRISEKNFRRYSKSLRQIAAKNRLDPNLAPSSI